MCAFWKKKKNHSIKTQSQNCQSEGEPGKGGSRRLTLLMLPVWNGRWAYHLPKAGRLLFAQEIVPRKGIGSFVS